MKRLSIRVSGKVQGVNYRHYTTKKANTIGLTGFVRNEDDGSVYIEAQGNADGLNELVEWCRHGPERARVQKVESTEIPSREEIAFQQVR
jgi:acylphosphatase